MQKKPAPIPAPLPAAPKKSYAPGHNKLPRHAMHARGKNRGMC